MNNVFRSCALGFISFLLSISMLSHSALGNSSGAKPPMPKDQIIWARQILQEYPTSAARRGLYGSVKVEVGVNAEGKVVGCSILITSGHKELDQAACTGMRKFAVFYPAIDSYGKLTAGLYSIVINYNKS
jgi:periplasmic protein TonB